MPKKSYGLLMFNFENSSIKFFLVHPGGPFWKNKDKGAWSIPKGEPSENETPLQTAQREMEEETGITPPKKENSYLYLGKTKQNSGKIIHVWAFKGNWNKKLNCTSFVKIYSKKFPEVDKAEFFDIKTAKEKINPSQRIFLKRLLEKIKSSNDNFI